MMQTWQSIFQALILSAKFNSNYIILTSFMETMPLNYFPLETGYIYRPV